MDLSFFTVQWLAFAVSLISWKMVQGVDLDICATDPASIYGDGLFETHTFNAEEGILLVPRKLIGTVTLSGNDTGTYSFDEPYFSKHYNLKSKPRPAHFEIVFVKESYSHNSTTTSIPKQHNEATATQAPNSHKTTGSSIFVPLVNDAQSTTSPHAAGLTSSYGGRESSWSTVNPSYMNVSSSTTVNTTSGEVTTSATTEDIDISCVVAKIYQIYDLDREDSDTHYLTINTVDDDTLWGFPIIVVINVTDINDNSPTFVKDSLNTRISNNTRPGTIVAEIKAVDKDIGINADLRYSLPINTERRGDEPASPEFPTFIIHEKYGIVALVGNIVDLVPPTKITFSVVVKDNGASYVANRATASVTVSIIDNTWAPEMNPAVQSITISAGAIAGIVLGSILLGVLTTVGFLCWRKRSRHWQRNGQLELMLDDENLISA